MPAGPFNEGLIRMVSERSDEHQALGLVDLIVLNALHRERRLTVVELSSLLQRNQTDALSVLDRMIDSALVEFRGEDCANCRHTATVCASR